MTYDEINEAYGFEAITGFPLTEVQKTDIQTFYEWKWSLNRYEVGGGKTVVSTAVSLMNGSDVTVVAVLPVLIPPWVRWLTRLQHAQGPVLEYRGTPKERKLMDLKAPRWIVMSHAILRTDFDRIYEELKGKSLDLIVDEAHATGIFGELGRGLVYELGLCEHVFARIMTFGKALGTHGAAVLGNNELRSFLINFSRSFIYTTSASFLSPRS